MARRIRAPRYDSLRPASALASRIAAASSKKVGTKCELLLLAALRHRALNPRIAVSDLPGRPDFVFPRERLVVFCDGDFWHGRRFEERRRRLTKGHNSSYWIQKIKTNMARDRRNARTLRNAGWCVLRLWECRIVKDPDKAAARVHAALEKRRG